MKRVATVNDLAVSIAKANPVHDIYTRIDVGAMSLSVRLSVSATLSAGLALATITSAPSTSTRRHNRYAELV